MPLYEYICSNCKAGFEILISSSEKAVCPLCSSEDLERVLSTISIGRAGSSSSGEELPTGCHGCPNRGQGGSCSFE